MATKTDEAPWLSQGEEKRAFVREMFADVAPSYDRINSVMCLRLHHKWRRMAVDAIQLNQGDAALDVCCGTGDFLAPLTRAVGKTGRIVGLD
ncbi:MAG TPA: class I SAM-dependent methyltransferase, partial [Fimbriimonadaceae bacterium]|nr:class I SAM-dependent methyltransferase [Fimbriimonadaceae bacterium]